MQVCDRLVVLREGRVEQEGPPADVYRYPASIYVAEFVGVANRLKGRIVENGGGARVTVETDLGEVISTEKLSTATDGDVAVLIRPHHLTISQGRASEGPNRWTGRIAVRMFRGSWMQYLVSVGAVTLAVWSSDHSLEEGTEVQVAVSPSDVFVRRGAAA